MCPEGERWASTMCHTAESLTYETSTTAADATRARKWKVGGRAGGMMRITRNAPNATDGEIKGPPPPPPQRHFICRRFEWAGPGGSDAPVRVSAIEEADANIKGVTHLPVFKGPHFNTSAGSRAGRGRPAFAPPPPPARPPRRHLCLFWPRRSLCDGFVHLFFLLLLFPFFAFQ